MNRTHVHLSIRDDDSRDVLLEVDATCPTAWAAKDLTRAIADVLGDHLEALEHEATRQRTADAKQCAEAELRRRIGLQ